MRRNAHTIIALALFLSLGCSLAQAQTSENKVFTLEECIQMALKNNPGIISAEKYYTLAKNNVWTAWGQLLPTVNTDYEYKKTKTGPSSESSSFPGSESISESYYANINSSFNVGDLILSLYQTNAEKNSEYDSYMLAKQSIVYSVKQNYFELLKAGMLLEIQKDAAQRGEQQLKIAQSRYDLGSASLSDVLKAKVQYGNEKLFLITAQNNVKLSQARLNALIGRDVNLPLEVKDVLISPEVDYTYETALQEAIQNNYEYRKAYQNMRSAKYQLGSALYQWLPNLSIGFNYNWANRDLGMIDNIWKTDYGWYAYWIVNINIFNGFQKKAAISNARINSRYAKQNYRQTKENVALEVKEAYLAIKQANEKLSLTGESVRSAKEDLDLVQEKYNLGAATMLEVMDADVSFKQAKSNEVQALFDYNLAFAGLEKAMGR